MPRNEPLSRRRNWRAGQASGSERRAPVQRNRALPINKIPARPDGSIAWWEHQQAWEAYHALYPSQPAESVARRGGFTYPELIAYLGHEPTTWLPRQ